MVAVVAAWRLDGLPGDLESCRSTRSDDCLTLLGEDDLVESAAGMNVFAVGAPIGEGGLVVQTAESMRLETADFVVVILGEHEILRDAVLSHVSKSHKA